tara:strand:+ start:95 stop:655 length:561 start_codon:yes stop_codon:yes gene_type:complete
MILTLLFNGNVYANKISLIDIKIGDKMNDHFSNKQISKYYVENPSGTPSGERIMGKDLTYSFIALESKEGVFNKDYDFYQIYYENDTKKIVSISGTDKTTDLDVCLKKRNDKVLKYKSKNRITTLFNRDDSTDTFSDGLKTDNVTFHGPTKIFAFACYEWSSDDIEYSFTIYETKYNDFVYEKMNK